MKIDTFNVAAPSTKSATKTFYDPRNPSTPITLTLKSPNLIDISNMQDTAGRFQEYYSDKPFPAVQGNFITIGPHLAMQVASIFCCQVGSKDEIYSMEELVAMTITMPTVYNDISKAIEELNSESDLGKLMEGRLSLKPSQDMLVGTQDLMNE